MHNIMCVFSEVCIKQYRTVISIQRGEVDMLNEIVFFTIIPNMYVCIPYPGADLAYTYVHMYVCVYSEL